MPEQACKDYILQIYMKWRGAVRLLSSMGAPPSASMLTLGEAANRVGRKGTAWSWPSYSHLSCWRSRTYYHIDRKKYQHGFEADSMYMILCIYWEYEDMILIICLRSFEAPTVHQCLDGPCLACLLRRSGTWIPTTAILNQV